MVAIFFRGRRDPQQFSRFYLTVRRQPADRQLPGGQRSSLVEHKRVDPSGGLDIADVLDQNTQSGGGGKRRHHGGG